MEPRIKKPILLDDLKHLDHIEKVIVESLEQALYRVEIETNGQCFYVVETPGKTLVRRSILEIQTLLIPYVVGNMYLRHISPYDEMIGLEENLDSNELLVPLGDYFAKLPDRALH